MKARTKTGPKLGWFIAALAIGVVGAACGGVVAGGDAGGGGGDGGGGGGGDGGGGGGSGCPTSPPTGGGACTPVGIQCEYGTNPDPGCNSLFLCQSNGWLDESTDIACPPQNLCPATFASVPVGVDCTPEGLACAYPQGECVCTTSFGGPQKLTPAWDCFTPNTGCPNPRPDIGTSCSQPELDCNYGACSGGVDLVCRDGHWQQQITPCPL